MPPVRPAPHQDDQKKGGECPPCASVGQQAQHLGIKGHRRLIPPALVKDILHQLPEACEGADAAGLAEGKEKPGAGALKPEAAMGVQVGVRGCHGGRSAGPFPAAGRGQGPAQRAWPDP